MLSDCIRWTPSQPSLQCEMNAEGYGDLPLNWTSVTLTGQMISDVVSVESASQRCCVDRAWISELLCWSRSCCVDKGLISELLCWQWFYLQDVRLTKAWSERCVDKGLISELLCWQWFYLQDVRLTKVWSERCVDKGLISEMWHWQSLDLRDAGHHHSRRAGTWLAWDRGHDGALQRTQCWGGEPAGGFWQIPTDWPILHLSGTLPVQRGMSGRMQKEGISDRMEKEGMSDRMENVRMEKDSMSERMKKEGMLDRMKKGVCQSEEGEYVRQNEEGGMSEWRRGYVRVKKGGMSEWRRGVCQAEWRRKVYQAEWRRRVCQTECRRRVCQNAEGGMSCIMKKELGYVGQKAWGGYVRQNEEGG